MVSTFEWSSLLGSSRPLPSGVGSFFPFGSAGMAPKRAPAGAGATGDPAAIRAAAYEPLGRQGWQPRGAVAGGVGWCGPPWCFRARLLPLPPDPSAAPEDPAGGPRAMVQGGALRLPGLGLAVARWVIPGAVLLGMWLHALKVCTAHS